MASLLSSLSAILVPSHMSLVHALFVYAMIGMLSLFLVGSLFVLYLYFTYPDRALFTASQSSRPDIPLVKEGTIPILGNLPLLNDAGLYFIEKSLDLTRQYGETYRLTFGFPIPSWLTFNGLVSQEIISINNPKDVEHVLRDPYKYVKGRDSFLMQKPLLGHGIFSSDGDAWSVQRKVASSIFNVKLSRDSYNPVFREDAVKVRRHLEEARRLGAIVDLQDLLLRSTMSSFVAIAMGKQIGGLDALGTVDAKGRYSLPAVPFSDAFDALNNVVFARSFDPIWNLMEPLSGKSAKIAAWKRTVDGFALDVITEKKRKLAGKQGGDGESGRKDLLDLFMATKNDDGSELTDEQLRDVVINFLIAGRDTTAQTLSWLFYSLHHNPTAERKTRSEILTKLPPASAKQDSEAQTPLPISLPGYNDLASLKYSTALFHEVLRLHANVPVNGKEALEDDVLPTGARIRKGDFIQFAPWVMGRLESIWGSDASEMKPERWIGNDGELKKESHFKWPVFNAGPRICLGMQMATQEAMILVAAILSSFHLELVDEDEPSKWAVWDVDPAKRKGRYDGALTLALRGGIHFKVHLVEEKETE